jgi:hypothetical protein
MMKKITLLLFLTVIMSAVPLVAQEAQEAESFFCVTIPAFMVYPHTKGYVFTYRKNSTETGRLFFPYDWFSRAPASNEVPTKGLLRILKPGNTWPQVSLFYRDGQFSHAKLYIRPEPIHESWGRLLRGINFDAEFENADPPVLDFGGPK